MNIRSYRSIMRPAVTLLSLGVLISFVPFFLSTLKRVNGGPGHEFLWDDIVTMPALAVSALFMTAFALAVLGGPIRIFCARRLLPERRFRVGPFVCLARVIASNCYLIFLRVFGRRRTGFAPVRPRKLTTGPLGRPPAPGKAAGAGQAQPNARSAKKTRKPS